MRQVGRGYTAVAGQVDHVFCYLLCNRMAADLVIKQRRAWYRRKRSIKPLAKVYTLGPEIGHGILAALHEERNTWSNADFTLCRIPERRKAELMEHRP